MDVLFKKYFWLINILVLTVAGIATALTLSSVISYQFLSFAPDEDKKASEEEAELAEEEGLISRAVVKRAAEMERAEAASVQALQVQPTEAAASQQTEQPKEDGAAQGTQQAQPRLNLEYIAAVTVSDETKNMALVKVDGMGPAWVAVTDDPKFRAAEVAVKQNRSPTPQPSAPPGPGGRKRGGASVIPEPSTPSASPSAAEAALTGPSGYVVTRITNYYIEINNTDYYYLWSKEKPLEPQPTLAQAPAPTVQPDDAGAQPRGQPQPRQPVANNVAQPNMEGIRQVGDNEWHIDRNRINQELSDMGKIGIRPQQYKDPETGQSGFRLMGIRSSSVFGAIGFKNGDVVVGVNGSPIDSPMKAMELLTQFQDANNVQVDVLRGGQQQTLTYKIE